MKNFEDLFIKEQLAKSSQDGAKANSLKTRKNLNKQKKRIIEIDNFIYAHLRR